MSSGVSQVKKRFAEMATYLHKDDKGQQLLKLLKDDVNVLRKSLAAAEAAKDTAAALMETARQRADKAETAAVSLTESNKQLRDQNNSLQLQVSLLSQRLEVTEELENVADMAVVDREYTGAARVMKRLRRTLPKCPGACVLTQQQLKLVLARGCVFDRHEIVTGWDAPDMWLLGATVAMVSGMFGQCVVLVRENYVRALAPDGRPDANNPKALAEIPLYQQFVRWFSANLAAMSEEVARRKALNTAIGYRSGVSPELSQDDTLTGLGLDGDVGPEAATENNK